MLVGDVVGGRYRLVRLLGRGGMGVVYEAYDDGLDRAVALKVLNPPMADEDFSVRFSREAAVLARLRSPHILTIFDHGTYGDHMYLVTELVPDGDLQTWVRERGPVAPLTAVRLCEQLCDALSDAHHLGVIHRDVKPANVLLWNRRDGLWSYLADFGIAREGSDALTKSGAVVGSVAYMAPERHLGQEADERSDLYSVGCVLWVLLEGQAPYSGTDFQVMNSHLNEPIPKLSGNVVGRDLIAPVLDRLLAKEPDQRMVSADDARAALAGLAARLSIVAGADVAPAAPDVATTTGSSDEPGVTMMRAFSGELIPARPPTDVPGGPPEEPTTLTPRAAAPRASADPPRGRRPAVLAAVVAVLLVVVGVAAAVALGGGGPEETNASESSGTTPSAPVSTPTTEPAEQVEPPSSPRVEHSSAYRGVRFAVAPVTDAVLEVRRDGQWEDLTASTFTEPTAQGGDRVCLSFRAVSTGSGGASKPQEVCERAAPPRIGWERVNRPCATPTGLPCAYFNVDVAGFRSGARLPISLSTLDGEVLCGTPSCLRPVPIGKDGRGKADGSLRKDGRPAAFLVSLATDGTPITFVLEVGDESIRTRQPVR